MSSVAPRHVGSFWTRDGICVPCIFRQIPIHCTSREVRYLFLKWEPIVLPDFLLWALRVSYGAFLSSAWSRSPKYKSYFRNVTKAGTQWVDKYKLTNKVYVWTCIRRKNNRPVEINETMSQNTFELFGGKALRKRKHFYALPHLFPPVAAVVPFNSSYLS